MNSAKTVAEYALMAVLVVLLISLVFSYVLGQPALLAYVESGSMEPTLNTGDGFIVVPSAVAGEIERGDVVMFEAEMVNDGALTTHRVVDVRDGGYITQGDANPFTDQSRDEPPVTEGQVKGVALQIGGDVVRLPHLGTGVMALQSTFERLNRAVAAQVGLHRIGTERMMYLLFIFGMVLYGSSFLLGEGRRSRSETRKRGRRSREGIFSTTTVIAAFVLVLVLVTTLAMVLPAGTHTFGIVSSESNPDRPTVVPVGGSDQLTFPTHNGGFLPIITYFEPASQGVDVEPHRMALAANESMNATITFHAPDETGYVVRSVAERRYIVLVPPTLIDTLYAVHPWLPYVAINGVVASVLVVVGVVLSGGSDKIRLRSRKRPRAGGWFDWL